MDLNSALLFKETVTVIVSPSFTVFADVLELTFTASAAKTETESENINAKQIKKLIIFFINLSPYLCNGYFSRSKV